MNHEGYRLYLQKRNVPYSYESKQRRLLTINISTLLKIKLKDFLN